MPPKNRANKEGWHYEDPGVANIHLIQAPFRAPQQSWNQNIRGPGRTWTPAVITNLNSSPNTSAAPPDKAESAQQEQQKAAHGTDERGRDRSPRRQVKQNGEVAATQMDSSSPPPSEAGDAPEQIPQVARGHERYLPDPDNPDEALRLGWSEHDLGGQGDCGYRAAAGARHFCKKLMHLTARQAHTDAAELRAQVVLHCEKHAPRFQQAFCPEDESKAHQRNQKPPAQTFEEWAENQADPKVWANRFSFQAMAERIGMIVTIVTIWKKLPDDSWMRCTFASKFKHGQACAACKEPAVVLLLKKQHFTYLVPPPSLRIPTAWLAGEGNPSPETIDLTGEGKSSSARSQRTNRSTLPSKSKATSAFTPRSQCKSKTVHSQPRSRASSPSVHTWNGNSFSCTDSEGTPSVHTFVQSRSRKPTSKVQKSILKGNKLRTQPSGVSSRFARSFAASCNQGTAPTGASRRRLTGKQTVFHDSDSLPQQVRSPSQQAEALVWKCRL